MTDVEPRPATVSGPAPGHELRRVPARPEAVRAMRALAGEFAAAHGLGEPALGDIALAVSEAVANVVCHAYERGEHGAVELEATATADGIELTVADEGHGLRDQPSDGLGLGLWLIATSTADFRVTQRRPHGTEVWMRFIRRAT